MPICDPWWKRKQLSSFTHFPSPVEHKIRNVYINTMKVRSVFQTEFSFWVNKQSLYEMSLLYVKCARLSNVRVCALAAEPQLKKRKEKKKEIFFLPVPWVQLSLSNYLKDLYHRTWQYLIYHSWTRKWRHDSQREKGGLNGAEGGPIKSLFQLGIFRHDREKNREEKEWCIKSSTNLM